MFHIVVVDDNRADQALMASAFREAFKGRDVFELHAFEDGRGVLDFLNEKIGARPPEVIVLDLDLPGKTGIEVLSEIKSHPTLKNIPVVVFSTSESEEDVARAYSHVANTYIIKPMDLRRLYEVMDEVKRYWSSEEPPRKAAS